MAYAEALEIQRKLAESRIANGGSGIANRTSGIGNRGLRDLLLLVEHPPVVTTGRSTDFDNLTTSKELLEARGVELFDVERGGDVTFHGPGQIVGYLIYDLSEHKQDLHWFLRKIEEALIVALDSFGVVAGRNEEYTGVWVEDRKIGSIGIHVKQWVTWHGFALNVLTDLSFFDLIVPCGIPQVTMTSIQKELGDRAPRDLWGRALDSVVLGFCEAFEQRPQVMGVDEIEM